MESVDLLRELAISMLLGLLVGLQRERTEAEMAGFRTFPLITTFGTLCARLTQSLDNQWIMAAGFLGVIAVIAIGNISKLKQEKPGAGVTTEIAVLVMFAVGAFVVVGPWIVAAAITAGVAILLQMKPQLHGFAKRVGDEDFRAILQFVLITFIILPVVPNTNYDLLKPLRTIFPGINGKFAEDTFNVLNPHQIWLMVVLVVAISLGGYVSYKLLGRRAGIVLGGILGGTISSTATTVSYARRTVTTPDAAGMAAIVIVTAGTVTYIRVLLEIAITAPAFLLSAGGPILVMFAVSVLLAVVTWFSHRHGEQEMPSQGNPAELKSAMLFALVYAFILLAVAAGKELLDDQWLYAIAALSGMTDMDAITLSTSRLVQTGRLTHDAGWRLIVVATMSNLVFKGLIVAFIGERNLLKKVSVLFGLSILSGAAVLMFWP